MHPDLAARRRVLLLIFDRYIASERAWSAGQQEMRAWFPKSSWSELPRIGNPGSKIRVLYEHRERCIQQLEVAKLKLDVAKSRLTKTHQVKLESGSLLLTYFERDPNGM